MRTTWESIAEIRAMDDNKHDLSVNKLKVANLWQLAKL
jgi:hypothetical protein